MLSSSIMPAAKFPEAYTELPQMDPNMEKRELSLKFESRHIRLFQVGGWKRHKSLPESTDVILSLMELVQSWQQKMGNHIILVHCMNGVEKSGLFFLISAVIERMKIEQDVAIPQIIEEWRGEICRNGVEKSGLFCLISAVIERMKIEQDVAIPQIIEEMRNAREQLIPSVEQFQFCHEAVQGFMHQYDTYSNFTI